MILPLVCHSQVLLGQLNDQKSQPAHAMTRHQADFSHTAVS